jgi:hypothetical protein
MYSIGDSHFIALNLIIYTGKNAKGLICTLHTHKGLYMNDSFAYFHVIDSYSYIKRKGELKKRCAEFDILMVVTVKSAFFRVVVLWSLVRAQCFGGTSCSV